MHPHVRKGNQVHADHFRSLHDGNGWIARGWEVFLVNRRIGVSRLRPDWVIVNRAEKRAFIIDITSKYAPKHYQKGMAYVLELETVLAGPGWDIRYIEDYWLNPDDPSRDATRH